MQKIINRQNSLLLYITLVTSNHKFLSYKQGCGAGARSQSFSVEPELFLKFSWSRSCFSNLAGAGAGGKFSSASSGPFLRCIIHHYLLSVLKSKAL